MTPGTATGRRGLLAATIAAIGIKVYNWVAAQIAGMAASCLWIDSPAFVGPLSSRTAGSDLSFFMGLLVGGIVYYLLARRSVAAETAGLDPVAAAGS